MKVLITRPRSQAGPFAEALSRAGFEPVFLPVIEVRPVDDLSELQKALDSLPTYDWIVFTSVNAVEITFDQIDAWKAARGKPRIAAIGPKTAEALKARGAKPDFVPAEYVAEAILPGLGDVRGKRILLPGAEIGRDVLPAALVAAGGSPHEISIYRTLPTEPDPAGLAALRAGVDVVTFTSPSTVENFVSLTEGCGLDPLHLPGGPWVACIGPVTEQAARRCGFTRLIVARDHTTEGIIEALKVQRQRGGYMSMLESERTALNSQRSTMVDRPRRLRATANLRALVRETEVNPRDFIYPMFVRHGSGRTGIRSMPGISQLSVEDSVREAEVAASLGIPAVILFGIPAEKDPIGLENFAPDGIVQLAIRAIKRALPEMIVVTDVCLCEYTDHGHCGILNQGSGGPESRPNPSLPEGYVLNDETLEVLAKVALSHAESGADIVAPSGMIDGMVGAIRSALDGSGFSNVPILSYAVKYASSFYGPFREAAEGAPKFGDRKSHQMDPANAREALREAALDVEQGADMLMVKPALAYLDVIRLVKDNYPEIPLAAYNVSGEYSMIKAAAANGWVDEAKVTLETLTAIKRAGADMILTYHALDAARWLK